MRVLITNAVISNTGDAAILQGIEDSLVRAGVCNRDDITVCDSDARGTSVVYGEKRIRQQLTVSPPRSRPRLRRALQRLRSVLGRTVVRRPELASFLLLKTPLRYTEYGAAYNAMNAADVVISTGGTYLVDHYKFTDKVTELEIARSMGKPVFLWTQSMGPFKTEPARSDIQRLDGWLSGLFCRDLRSFRSWEESNSVPTLGRVVPDVAFAMDIEVANDASGNEKEKYAILSVREWSKGGVDSDGYSQSSYETGMRFMASQLLERGWKVVALSTCQGLERYAVDDSEYASKVFTDLDVDIIKDHHTPRQLVKALAAADLVVTTRMHLSILSLMAKVPTLAVAYEFKTMELFDSLGLGHAAVKIEDINEAWVSAALMTHENSPDSLKVGPDVLTQLRDSASEPASALLGN